MDGVLIVDKPAGLTSHDVVNVIRRITGVKRVGHAGTLDPAATGVLIILIGKATKLSGDFLNDDKKYSGTFKFGLATDTLDADGKVVEESDADGLQRNDIEESAAKMTGRIEQVPPMVSAIKVGGQPLYKAARRGEVVDVPPRLVDIKVFRITDWRPGSKAEADFMIECSKGTYVRSIARDLGSSVGVCAHLSSLRRTGSGRYDVGNAVRLDDVKEGGINEISRRLIPIDAL
jgi:tRNA pseudouridine55 synthase